jgi:TRAP-type mannitol/chloroaromatic compound transport system substrate-binding protein
MKGEIKMRKKAIVLVSLVVAGLIVFPFLSNSVQAQGAKVYKWRLQSFFGPGSPAFDESLPKFIQNVKTMSNGQIDITLYPPAALVPSFELFNNMGKGVVDMGLDAGTYWMGFLPIGELIWGWPFTFQHKQEHDYFYNVMGGVDILRKATATRGVYVLVNAVHNKYGSITSRVPIKGLKDLKGLKIRTFSAYAKIMQRFGSSTMTIPGEEMYTALATKVLDGITWGAPADSGAFKLYEIAKYYTMPAWHPQSPLTITMNLKTWQDLPDHLKSILQTTAHAYAEDVAARTWYKDAATLEDWVKNKGVVVNWFSDEDMKTARKISMELLDEKAKQDAFCNEHVTLLKKSLRTFGYLD